ncbi:hypothetical protein WBS46_16885 [Bacillus albus]|uniref:hypothetical protein n=1 Tax=Bacillus albus TaxID=2026189 RepID=UPI001009E558|nr:hypothetical protein [Bacillus albus]RXJ19851.1 hypothetical protein ETJ91_00325 [Bacillus albus]RXJ30072.1 hypothetical protein ETJ76_15765 [Bacillus albus]RXJ31664.1 hypothetical protein ETJ90_08540 [Bacillus albus]RXJ42888.1 hypothetical protein ETJ89_08545 [Bacillus albus]RXJ59816.1 hypothetical protein ETJ66_08540 [Bacillus albus]
MAIIFLGEPDANGIAVVRSIVYQSKYLDEETKAQGVEVNNVPPLVDPEGKTMVLSYNTVSKELVVGYIDRPIEPENINTEQK